MNYDHIFLKVNLKYAPLHSKTVYVKSEFLKKFDLELFPSRPINYMQCQYNFSVLIAKYFIVGTTIK